jgi:hypothetical protein
LSRSEDFAHIAVVQGDAPRLRDGTLDFRKYQTRYERNDYATFSVAVAWRNAQRRWFEDFEYFVTLQKLGSAAEPARSELAAALVFYSGWRSYSSDRALEDFARLLNLNRVKPRVRSELLGRLRDLVSGPKPSDA